MKIKKHLNGLFYKIGLCTAIVLMAEVNASAQANTRDSFIRDSLDNYIVSALKDWHLPGLALCIVKDGKVVLMKGYGVKELGTADPVDENTLFMIGSNTKAFTASALALLQEEKKLSLDDRVTKWIPAFKLDNKAAGEQAIIRDLLCHRIGFRTFQGDFTYWTSNLTRAEVIEKMGHIKASYPFRTTWGYTNAAFLTAGEIIPRATGLQWEDFIKQRILLPLGMNRTVVLSKDITAADNKAQPYTYQDNKLVKIPFCSIDNLASAGSISSSVSDLSKWVLLNLDSGKYNGQQLLPREVILETHKPHSIMSSPSNPFNRSHLAVYGLGFEMQDYEGREIVMHTGGVNGFVSSVTMIPDERLGIIILTNSDQNLLFEALKWEILDSYLNLPYRNYSGVFLNYDQKKRARRLAEEQKLKDSAALHPSTPIPLSAYAGNYSNQVYGNMKVESKEGELRMIFSHHPNMYASLRPIGGNRFYAVFSDPEFSHAVFPFTVVNNKVKSVTVKVADFIEYNAYEFNRQN